jgi:hypothetical protein
MDILEINKLPLNLRQINDEPFATIDSKAITLTEELLSHTVNMINQAFHLGSEGIWKDPLRNRTSLE